MAKRRGGGLTYCERQALAALTKAAENGDVCPTNLDLVILTGYNSDSMGPKLIQSLENEGLIYVERHQRFRRVKIFATGKWTARHPSQRTARKHVPRGSGSMVGKLAKKARQI